MGTQSDAPNTPPVVTDLFVRPARPAPGEILRAEAHVVDSDGDPITLHYSWRMLGTDQTGNSPQFKPRQGKRGDLIEVSVVARDPFDESSPFTTSLRLQNSSPTIHGIEFNPKGEIRRDRDLAVIPRAVDPDGDRLRYRYDWLVNGSRRDADGSRLPRQEFKRGDSIELRLVVSDGQGGQDELRTKAIRVSNSAPRIVSEPGGISAEGLFLYPLKVEDADHDRPLRYSLLDGPPGMKMEPVTGHLTWRPRAADVGGHRVHVQVVDGHGGKANQEFTLSFDIEEIRQR